MKTTSLFLCSVLVGCIDPSEQPELGATDQAVDNAARDRYLSIGNGSVFSQVQSGGGFAPVESLGSIGAGMTKLATERNQDGRLSAFAIGPNPDRTLFGRYQTSVGGGWNPEGWQSLGGGWIKQVVTARNLDGRIELFVLNDAGQAFHRYQTTPNGGWNSDGWEPFGGNAIQTIAATRGNNGRLEVFAAGGDGLLYQRTQFVANSGWNEWVLVPNSVSFNLHNVVVTLDSNNQPMVLALDSANNVKFTREDGVGAFTAITTLGDRPMEQVVAGKTHDGRVDVLGISRGFVYDCVQPDLYSTAFGRFNSVGWGSVAQLSWTNEVFDIPVVFARTTSGQIAFATSRDSVPLPSWTALQPLGVTGQSDLVSIDQQ